MKKIKFLTLAVAMLLSVGNVYAQTDNTFCFLDANGNEVPNGSNLTFYAEKKEKVPGMGDLFGYNIQADFDLKVRNNSKSTATVAMKVEAPENPTHGKVQICFPRDCDTNDRGTFTTQSGEMAAGAVEPLRSEWIFGIINPGDVDNISYGEESLSLTLLNGSLTGPTVKIRCIYADPAGIADMESDKNATVIGRYDSKGNKLSAPTKGLNLVKMSNGEIRKIIVK